MTGGKLHEYSTSIRKLKKQCIDAGMDEQEFKEIYLESLKYVQKTQKPYQSCRISIIRKLFIIFTSIFLIFLVVFNFKSLYNCLLCNIQDYIYPGLRFIRRLSIPIISLFPSLTEYYQETCLIQNPFFTVVDMDCWPCSTVYDVKEMYDPKPSAKHQLAPFIYETDQRLISIEMLQNLYWKHKDVLESDVPKVLINNKYNSYPKDLFEMWKSAEKGLYIWKFNTMNEAQVLRQLISRPKIVPKFGQSTERFIVIDSSLETFKIPDTECSFSFLLSLNGSRTVTLVPADECKHQCKALQVELKESYLLWYNWWYWRPSIQSTTRNGTFIAHIGSYC